MAKCSAVVASKRRLVNRQKTPPGVNPAAREGRNWRCSAFDRVGPLAALVLGGADVEAQLLPNRARQEPAYALWACHEEAFMIAASVAPSGRFSMSRILAALLPSRAPPAFLPPLGAFLAGLAFFPDLLFLGAT